MSETHFWRIGLCLALFSLFRGDNPKCHVTEDIDGQTGAVHHPQVVQVAHHFLEVERDLERYVVIEAWLSENYVIIPAKIVENKP